MSVGLRESHQFNLSRIRERTAHMLVRTLDAAVWAMASSPALLDLPRISLLTRPVRGSSGA